jgi:thioredoxin reductase (NADPH)
MPEIHDVCVIGCGPAGIAAAVQLRRTGVQPVVFEAERIGGLLNNAYLVENYPGFPRGISGARLVKKFKQHLNQWDIPVIMDSVDRIDQEGHQFVLHANRIYRSRFVVYAAGTRPRTLAAADAVVEKYIVYDIMGLGRVRNKHIVMIGAGDAAFDYALNLGRHNRITMLNRSRKRKGLPLLFSRLERGMYRKNVKYLPHTRAASIKRHAADTKYNLIVAARSGAGTKKIPCHYILAALGREPRLGSLSKRLMRLHPDSSTRFFFAGDVKNGDARQTAIAVGDGIKAAMKIALALHRRQRP